MSGHAGSSAVPHAVTAVAALRWQARSCAGSSPLYGALLARLADDADAGGPTAAVLEGHDDDSRGSALGLRLMAALHRAVLERRAPRLALHYPSVGGDGDADLAWPAVRDLLAEQPEQVRADLDRPCQTNEPGRAAALLLGLLHVARTRGRQRLRLLEIGASAGLNLRVDAYRIGALGPPDSPCRLVDPWEGPAPAATAYQLVERRGCDPAPVDATSAEGRLALTSSVWADQPARFGRLRGALAVAASVPAVVDRAGAAAWLRGRLAEPQPAGVVTVVWHSIVRQYVEAAEWADVEAQLAAAGPSVEHLAMEPEPHEAIPVTVGGVRIAVAGPHGPPVRALAPPSPSAATASATAPPRAPASATAPPRARPRPVIRPRPVPRDPPRAP